MRMPNYLKELFNNFLKTIGIWMLFGGIACTTIAYSSMLAGHDSIKGFLASLGSAILSGGVFAVILKSMQFLGVFREELTSIIYETTYLKGRKDTEAIWKRVCDVVSRGYFPDIKEQVQDTILKTYLPHAYEYYYEGLFYGIDISYETEDKTHIIIEETLDFTLKPADRSKEYSWSYDYTIEFKTNDRVETTLQEFLLDGENQLDKSNQNRIETKTDNRINVALTLKLKGKDAYRIALKERKKYPLDPYNSKDFSAGRFINKAEVQVTYPDDLRVVFQAMGTPKGFADRRNAGLHLISKEYQGLIFPHQGFRILFQKG